MRILHLTTEFPPVIFGGLGTAVGGLVKASATAGITTGVLLFGECAGGSYGKFVLLPKTARPVQATRLAVGARVFEVLWFQGIEAISQTAASWDPTFFTCIRSGSGPLRESCVLGLENRSFIRFTRLTARNMNSDEVLQSASPNGLGRKPSSRAPIGSLR